MHTRLLFVMWSVIMNGICVCVFQTDYYFEYTECDSTGSRWRVAIPHRQGSCSGLPEPVRGTDCSKSERTCDTEPSWFDLCQQ